MSVGSLMMFQPFFCNAATWPHQIKVFFDDVVNHKGIFSSWNSLKLRITTFNFRLFSSILELWLLDIFVLINMMRTGISTILIKTVPFCQHFMNGNLCW
mmetsp:Transcript_45997/g.55778  ORF Transcript_45997/g.55778 Transcript_45997/m.55778 type:complete len:99 (+) Transcript_45997:2284-2580(+)